ncbi:hypothetical protein HWV62_1448 [Athelia sp. TMB]|nr:hypothetical protein HWV62_1448 [Athelia sp. TMB]
MADDLQLPHELQTLSSLIEAKPESIAIGSDDFRAASLGAAKYIFDLALTTESPEQAPQTRSKSKRKRSPSPPAKPSLLLKETPLPSLFIDGMNEDQIWEQLDLRAKQLCDTLQEALEGNHMDEDELEEQGKDSVMGEEGEDIDMDEVDWDGEGSEDNSDEDDSDEDMKEDFDEGAGSAEEFGDDATQELRDPSSEEEEEEESPLLLDLPGKKRKRKAGGHPVLDDGFFDLASFNAEAEEAEAKSASKGRLGDDEDDDSDGAESVDLFAPVDNIEALEEEDVDDGGELFYRDFFDAPPREPGSKPKGKGKAKAPPVETPLPKKTTKVRFHDEVRVRNIKAKGKNMPLSSMYDDDDDEEYGAGGDGENAWHEELEDGEDDEASDSEDEDGSEAEDNEDEEGSEDGGRDTIARLKDDLFADEEEPEEEDLTAHEKRMTALREQIQELETENVAKKDWVLMGEATSRARPHNSLLEEDLEFERVMKAVPVITEESVQSLEERIKARILEGRFDDVVRLRPMDDKPFLPSRFFELQDTKSSQSLAQIYEDEFTAAQSGGVAGEDRDGKLKKEHHELNQVWDGICAKLDALCNAHYTPKQPKATISTVANVSAASLESALPTTKSTSTMLAPEEVFAPSPSDLRSRTEMTPAEKRALRGKERKSRKKQRDALDKSVDKFATKVKGIGGVKRQKAEALRGVVKNGKGVTVVGKKSKDILAKKPRTKLS